MDISKLIEEEAKLGFDDVIGIRNSGIPSFLDEWVVTGLLGRGSYGNVYRIVKPQKGLAAHESALKICPVATAEDAELRRQEVETQQLLKGHPNAVQIEDYALISREPPAMSYLLIRMELLNPLPVEGLSERETIRLGTEICSVLEKCYALQPRLVHCDIKPANILMTSDGRFKLGDFGMAKTMQASMTYTGNRGTPLYMAPEVATYTGYDSRCDIFSLGYTMLTMLNGGEHPYQDAGERKDILRKMYEPGRKHRIHGVSASLLKIINKMCQPTLSARYSRASFVRRDLERLVRKKEEAEREARLRADRIAELSRSQSKEKHAREEKQAQNALEKARKDLAKAQNASGKRSSDKGSIRRLSDSVDRAARIQQYVSNGLSYKEAQLKSAADRGELKTDRKHVAVAAAVFALLLVLCVGGAMLFSGAEQAMSTEPVKEEELRLSSGAEGAATHVDSSIAERAFTLEKIQGRAEYMLVKFRNTVETEVTIPSSYQGLPITEIGKSAFERTNITEVVIPKTVRTIGASAFRYCSALKKVSFSNGLEVIEAYAFKKCRLLENVVFPGSLREIREAAFEGCESINSLVLHSGVSFLGRSAFASCTSLQQVSLQTPRLKELPDYVFFGCGSLEKVSFEVIVPVKRIGRWAFGCCDLLESFKFPVAVEEIDANAFYGAELLEMVNVPQSVIIGDGAFGGCKGLVSVIIGEGTTSIGKSAFSGCSSLEQLIIPESVTEIGKTAFSRTNLSVFAPHEPSYYCDGYIGAYESWTVVDPDR